MNATGAKPLFPHHYGDNHPQHQKGGWALTLGALGVVFGDIGTSPLYALRECFIQSGSALVAESVYGFLSLIFWSLTLVVAIKYIIVLMQANNRGEGGIMALAALALHPTASKPRLRAAIYMVAIMGVALFYGDGMITPAISIVSAVEGIAVYSPALQFWVIPISLAILVVLFSVQRYGTAVVGKFAGPVMLVWFVVLGMLGLVHIADNPFILAAISPHHALQFIVEHSHMAFFALGAVVLCVTGAEAIYSDMGHFGPRPIRAAWFRLVYPALALNYFGQGALLLSNPAALESPFYKMVPEWGVLPLVLLATAATLVASQALITGAFSLTHQAIQLGLLPRMRVIHTDGEHRGQIYIPRINMLLLLGVVLLILLFPTSTTLAHMYGLAVTGTMFITTLLLFVLMRLIWRRSWLFVITAGGFFLFIDAIFFSANMMKIAEGGWVPIVIGIGIFTMMTTWKRGRDILVAKRQAVSMSVAEFMQKVRHDKPVRVPGTAIYLAYLPNVAPYPLLHNLEHNKVLHERVLLLTIRTEDRPVVADDERIILGDEGEGVWHMVVRYGFTENPRVLSALAIARRQGFDITVSDTSFFIGRDHLVLFHKPVMARWRMALFFFMAHTSASASDYFKLPRARVMEIGAQIDM